MAEQAPDVQEMERWRRKFAAEGNNRAWELASKPGRTGAETEEMVAAAYAAAYHWKQAGGPVHHARADVTLAHALSLAGQGQEAMKYAQRCLAYFEANPAEDWDVAFAHLEVALAAAAVGDRELHARHLARARELGEAIREEDDRQVFLDELGRV